MIRSFELRPGAGRTVEDFELARNPYGDELEMLRRAFISKSFGISDKLADVAVSTTPAGPTPTFESLLKTMQEIQQHIPHKPEPDRSGNANMVIGGLKIVVTDMLPPKRVAIKRERKWARRKQFQKDRRFDTTFEERPSDEVYIVGDKLMCSMKISNTLRDQIEKGDHATYSMGYVAEPSRKDASIFNDYRIDALFDGPLIKRGPLA